MGQRWGYTGTELVDPEGGDGGRRRREAEEEGQMERGELEEQTVLKLFFRVVYLTLHNTFAYVAGARCVWEGVCLIAASHWRMGFSVKGEGCPSNGLHCHTDAWNTTHTPSLRWNVLSVLFSTSWVQDHQAFTHTHSLFHTCTLTLTTHSHPSVLWSLTILCVSRRHTTSSQFHFHEVQIAFQPHLTLSRDGLMLGFLDAIMLLLAFKGIGFPRSGAGEEPLLLCVHN